MQYRSIYLPLLRKYIPKHVTYVSTSACLCTYVWRYHSRLSYISHISNRDNMNPERGGLPTLSTILRDDQSFRYILNVISFILQEESVSDLYAKSTKVLTEVSRSCCHLSSERFH